MKEEQAVSVGDAADEDAVAVLARSTFGIDYLYPYQRFVIANVLDGVDQVVIFPTGGGKSLCFQVPAQLLPGITLVIVPLRALAADQVRSLAARNVPAVVIEGGQSAAERTRITQDLRDGKVKIAYTTPEALLSDRGQDDLAGIAISHLVIDEAHCVSEWGESFRPAYLELGRICRDRSISIVSAFTATASAEVLEKVKAHLFSERSVRFVTTTPDRPNIVYRCVPVISKMHAISRLVAGEKKPLIVFSRTRKAAERYARAILARSAHPADANGSGPARASADPTPVRFYHAGLDPDERKEVERWFLGSKNGVLVATCAYGMGVDKPDVRTIVHADVPPSVEAYLQESGRAGRDGGPAAAVLLHSIEDRAFTAKIADPVARSRFERVLRYATDNADCRRSTLLSLIDSADVPPCSGCDVCEHGVVTAPEGEADILRFIRKHRRRYTLRESLQLLVGARSLDSVRLRFPGSAWFGAFDSWHPDDIEEAIITLVSARKAHIPLRGFWKYRLTV